MREPKTSRKLLRDDEARTFTFTVEQLNKKAAFNLVYGNITFWDVQYKDLNCHSRYRADKLDYKVLFTYNDKTRLLKFNR